MQCDRTTDLTGCQDSGGFMFTPENVKLFKQQVIDGDPACPWYKDEATMWLSDVTGMSVDDAKFDALYEKFWNAV
jgi:hypothetical protein